MDMLGKQGGGGTRIGMGGRVLYSEAPCVVFHCGRESADRRDADRTHPRGHSRGARCRRAFPFRPTTARPLRTRDPNETRRACQARGSGREADPIWRPDPDPRPDRRPPAPAHSPRAVRRARTTRHPPLPSRHSPPSAYPMDTGCRRTFTLCTGQHLPPSILCVCLHGPCAAARCARCGLSALLDRINLIVAFGPLNRQWPSNPARQRSPSRPHHDSTPLRSAPCSFRLAICSRRLRACRAASCSVRSFDGGGHASTQRRD